MSDYPPELRALLGLSEPDGVMPSTTGGFLPAPGPLPMPESFDVAMPVAPGVVPAVPAAAEPGGLGARVREAGGRALAFGIGALEPFQFTQDAFFALLAGARDENRSVKDYLNDVLGQASSYMPFGDAPERVSTGSEILGMYGVQDERVRRYAGFVLDIVGDPLLLGSGVSAVGRAARGLGAVTVGDSLMAFGRNIDDGLSLIPVRRGGEWRGVPVTAARAIPEPARVAVAQGVEEAIKSLVTLPGFDRITRILPQSVEARARLGREAGGEAFAAVGRAAQAGETVRELGLEAIDRVLEWLGPERDEFLDTLGRGLRGRAEAFNVPGRFTTEVRDTIIRQLAAVADQRGVAFLDPEELISAGRAGGPLLASTEEAVGFLDVARSAGERLRGMERRVGEDLLERAVENVRRVAGSQADVAEQAFRQSLNAITEADALTGYGLSMIGPIGRRFLQVASERFATLPVTGPVMDAAVAAQSMFTDIMRRGMRGEDVYSLERIAVGTGPVKPLVNVEDVLGTRTFGDFINQNSFFADLNLNSYLRSLNEGHLRRSLGVFMDDRTFNNWMASLEGGRLLPSSVIDEDNLLDALRSRGMGTEADLIDQYVQSLRSTALSRDPSQARGMGLVLSRDQLISHLLDNDVSGESAQRALDALAASTSSPAYQAFIDKVRSRLSSYRQLIEEPAAGSGGFLRAREDLANDVLEVLGEIANPLISIEESTRFGRRRIETTDYVRRLYDIASKAGLASDTFRPGLGNVALRGSQLYGPFQGKYVHPFVERLLSRAFKNADFRTDGAVQQLAAFVRGGYLAGPNILGANISGGLTTSMYLGLNPFEMVGEMAGVLRDMARRERGLAATIPDMDELLQFIPLSLTRMGDIAEVERGVRELRRGVTGATSNALRESINRLGGMLRTFVDNPAELVMGRARRGVPQGAGELAARAAGAAFGLQGFTTSETVMKLAAYRLAKRQGYTISEAAEMARLSTFDYSELPELITNLRRNGLLLFPGFSYFILGRTLGGALRRPGVTAAVNRMPDAIVDANFDEDVKNVLVDSMPDWMKLDIGIPVRMRELADGGQVFSMFPYAQMIPGLSWTQGALGPVTAFGESLSNLGLMGPALVDPLTAIMTGSGEGPLGARYGGQVFVPGESLDAQILQTLGYFYNSFAPATLRRTVGFRAGDGLTGLVPAIRDSMVPLPEEFASLGYDRNTILNRSVKRDIVDEAIGALTRSVFPVTVGGRIPTIQRTYENAQRTLQQELNAIRDQAERARLMGDEERVAELQLEYQRKAERFREIWVPRIERYREYTGENLEVVTQ